MKPPSIYELIKVDEYSATPKYLQLAQSVLHAVEAGKLVADDPLPSINEVSFELEIARDTVEKGYNYLKKVGAISSTPGKGYFVRTAVLKQTLKIFLLFNKLSAHKKIIYDSFIESLGGKASVDFYIYNNDFSLFKKLLTNRKEDYSYYVIIPHFLEGAEQALGLINELPKEKLLLLDKKLTGITGKYAAVYENFASDIQSALTSALEPLKKYHTLKIIFPKYSYYPVEILDGFLLFCRRHGFRQKVVHHILGEPIGDGEAYINLMEEDLVTLLEQVIALGLTLGKQVGVISYNDVPLKRIMLNGITTISTDFKMMGAKAAEILLTNSKEQCEMPFYLTLRGSL